MSRRLDPSWVVLDSCENAQHDRCVDLFRRPDGSFGFEAFRRDAEDAGRWTAVSSTAALRFPTREAAVAEAVRVVGWFEG